MTDKEPKPTRHKSDESVPQDTLKEAKRLMATAESHERRVALREESAGFLDERGESEQADRERTMADRERDAARNAWDRAMALQGPTQMTEPPSGSNPFEIPIPTRKDFLRNVERVAPKAATAQPTHTEPPPEDSPGRVARELDELRRVAPRPFGDYFPEARRWITIFDTEFYPDTLESALARYGPVLGAFEQLVDESTNSADLLRDIQAAPKEMRGQLLRVFRKYVSPDTSVEMLKRVRRTEEVIKDFGQRFRPIEDVRLNLRRRPSPDEALIALLAEYGDRGKKGYELTEAFFLWFEAEFTDVGWSIVGPTGAGRDIELKDVVADYPTKTPADFVVLDPEGVVRIVGFARYDSDRGGAQEDDRVGGNERRLREILRFPKASGPQLKVVFLNDGPGLLLGSMWKDYDQIERGGEGRAIVTTLAMAQAGRFSTEWIESAPT
jgi:hypothetical protein